MFTETIKLIKDKEYDNTVAKLLPLSSSDDEAVKSQANYLLGYIYTQWDYKKKIQNLLNDICTPT